MNMKYEDPNMEAYWNSLPASVQAIIQNSGIEICSLGMLRKLGDYYQTAMARESEDTFATVVFINKGGFVV